MTKTIYAIVTGEPGLSICREWQDKWKAAHRAAFDFAKSMGASGWVPDHEYDLVGLIPNGDIPQGWKQARRKNRVFLEPAKGSAGAAAREAIAALPEHPKQNDLPALLGIPTVISYEYPDNKGWGSSSMSGGYWHAVELMWCDDDALVLRLPDVGAHIADVRQRHPDAVISFGPDEATSWSFPDWLKPISEAEWKLMQAQAEVRREQAKAQPAPAL